MNDREWVPGRYAFLSQEYSAIPEYDKRILSMAKVSGIEAKSQYHSFLTYDGTESLYFDNDMHFIKSGHKVMAKGLAALLRGESNSRHRCD